MLKFSDGQDGAKVVRLILITAASGYNSAVKKCQYILSVARQIQTRQLLTLQLLISRVEFGCTVWQYLAHRTKLRKYSVIRLEFG